MKIWAIGGTTRRSAIVAALAVTIAACGPASDEGAAPSVPRIKSSRALGTTRGPNGERPTPNSALRLSSSEVAKVRAGHYTAALVWHESSDFTSAVDAGVRDEFSVLGIKVVAETSANFDAAKQKSDVETVQAKRPSVLLTLPVDPVVTASAYQAAARQGTKIVLLSSVPQGMTYGRDYVNLVTDDLVQMGKRAADALAAAIGGKGKIAYFFHEANHYVTNQRDQAFLSTITGNYPDIDVVAKRGIADPNRAQDVATATLLQHPDLAGAYVMFAQPPGEGVLAALRARYGQGWADVRADRRPRVRPRPGDGEVGSVRAPRQEGSAVRDRAGADHHEVESRPGLSRIAAPQPACERHEGAR
jgi:ABC-type sugar transport system substrate-binding protein